MKITSIFGVVKKAIFVFRVFAGMFPNRTKKARRIVDAVEPMVKPIEKATGELTGGKNDLVD